jgi:hypothetical protein
LHHIIIIKEAAAPALSAAFREFPPKTYALPKLMFCTQGTRSGIATILFVDYSTGGSIDGEIRAAETNLSKVTATTIVISGHGAVTVKAGLTLFRDVLVDA